MRSTMSIGASASAVLMGLHVAVRMRCSDGRICILLAVAPASTKATQSAAKTKSSTTAPADASAYQSSAGQTRNKTQTAANADARRQSALRDRGGAIRGVAARAEIALW